MASTTSPAPDAPITGLQQAMQLHQAGQLDEALGLYLGLLEADPGLADAWHLMGLLHAQRGHLEEARALVLKATELLPGEALFHNNLGNLWLEAGQADAALASYRRAHELAPNRVDIWNNLGVLLSQRGEAAEAEQLLTRVVQTAPAFVDARENLANHYLRQGQIQEAVQVCLDALLVAPRNPPLRRLLGAAYACLDMLPEAAALYRAWLKEEPDNVEAAYKLRACSQQDVPERAPDAFVTKTFDAFANSFDAKLAQLSYRAPELVAAAVARHAGAPQGALDILDAGCGTGLCGPLVAPWKRQLVGVDLSPGMLQKARPRGVYDELLVGELVAFLTSRPASCDMLISADTLCYFGALEAFAAAAQGALRAGGLLFFTVEAHADEPGAPDYHLHGHGRYSHRRGYVEAALTAAGLQPLALDAAVLRMEANKPVDGWVVSARRPAA